MDSDASADHMAEDQPYDKPMKINHKIHDNVLQCFSKLSNPSEKCIDAAISILKHLVRKQGSQDEICTELLYAIKRLASGMGSSRLDARTGFYSTFVTLLSTFPQITVTRVLDIVAKDLTIKSTQAKSEKAEVYTAQILLYGALIQSRALVSSSAEEQKNIVTNLLTTCEKRSYLPLAAYSFLKEFVEQVDENQFKKVLWPTLRETLQLPWPQQTLETLYLLLVARSRFPDAVDADFLRTHLGSPDIVHEDSLQHCCQLLMTIPRRSYLQHPVFQELCKALAASPLLSTFWADTMDLHLAKDKVNKMKEMTAAHVFYLILTHLTDSTQVPHFFTPHFIEFLIRSGQKKRERNEVGEKLQQGLDLVVKQFEGDPCPAQDESVLEIIEKLMFYPGDFRIEIITNYRIVRQLTARLDSKGVKKLCKLYQKVLKASKSRVCGLDGKTEQWNNNDRVLAAQLVSRLISHKAVQTSLKWKTKQLGILLQFGLFKGDKTLPQPVAGQIKDCFYKALDQHAPNLETLTKLLSSVASHLDEILNSKDHDVLWQPLTKKSLLAWSEMMNVVRRLEASDNDKKTSAIPLFHTMFLHLGLQLFSDPGMAEEALQELHSCYERVRSARKRKRALKEGDIEGEEPEWAEVAVDLLLSLLSNGSHLLRTLVMCVFPHLCPHLTPSALHQILHVLDPKSGRNPLSVRNDDGDEESSSESEGDVEEDENDNDVDEEEVEEEEEDDEDIWDEDEDEKETVNEKLRLAVRQALGTAASLTDTESINEEDIGEEEGKRLNSALSDAFKALKEARTTAQSKTKQSKESEALTHFRSRVMDMLDIVLGSEPSMSTCLDLIVPLFELLEFCMHDVHQKPLENKTRSCLRKLSSVSVWHKAGGVTHAQLQTALRWLTDKGKRTAPVFLDMAPERAACCTFLLRCSIHLADRAGGDAMLQLYRRALGDFLHKRDCLLNIAMFRNALNLTWEGKWVLVSDLVPLAFSPDVRTFSQLQALQLLKVFFSNRRHFQDATDITSLSPVNSQLVQHSKQLLTAVLEGGVDKPKSNYLVELCALLKTARHVEGGREPEAKWAELGEVMRTCYARADLGAGVKAAIRTFTTSLGINLLKKTSKPKKLDLPNGDVSHSNSDSDSEPEVKSSTKPEHKSKKKKHKNQIKLERRNSSSSNSEEPLPLKEKVKKTRSNNKLRNESRALRLAAMSEGIKPVNFSVKSEMNGVGKALNSKKPEKRKLSSASPNNHSKKLK